MELVDFSSANTMPVLVVCSSVYVPDSRLMVDDTTAHEVDVPEACTVSPLRVNVIPFTVFGRSSGSFHRFAHTWTGMFTLWEPAVIVRVVSPAVRPVTTTPPKSFAHNYSLVMVAIVWFPVFAVNSCDAALGRMRTVRRLASPTRTVTASTGWPESSVTLMDSGA